MDLYEISLEEISLEGLEGVSLFGLWKCLQKRQPTIKCAIDHWTKPYLWKQLALSKFLQFYHVDFDAPQKEPVPVNKAERLPKMPQFFIYDYREGTTGYSTSFYYRHNVTHEIRDEGNTVLVNLDQTIEKWGDDLRMVVTQDFRRRFLFGTSHPPVIDDVTPVRYIILEIIGKARWVGFMQADFQKYYGMDPRSSFHHIKLLLKLHLITKQSILLSQPINDVVTPVPPKSTKMLHLSKFSNVYTNNLQKAASKICTILENAPDGTIERNELKKLCSDIPQFKKIRQWLFQTGYIHYIVSGQIWSSDNMNPIQVTHFRACRPCYVSLVKKFHIIDVDDDKDDDFLDYIENCDDIEPRLIYEETLHHQAYRVIIASREKGITMKKLAEVMCIPYTMARSFIRYFDTNKIGRIVTIDHLKLKVQKIVAIQFLHQSETVQLIKSNKLKIEDHKRKLADMKPVIKNEPAHDQSISEQNLELADDIGFTRVSEKSKISLRHLARKNYILDSMKEKPVWEGYNELYKNLVFKEDSKRTTQGLCCRKTFKRLLELLHKEKQLNLYTTVVDENCVPPLKVTFYCANHISQTSQEYFDAVDASRARYYNLEKRREIKKAIREHPKKQKKSLPLSVPTIQKEETGTEKKSEDVSGNLTDTDDEDFKRSQSLSTSKQMQNRFFTFGRFQKLHILHVFLWKLVYGTEEDMQQLSLAGGPSIDFIDLVQSRHIWLNHAYGLPKYKQGPGWFNVGDIISLMPLELTCRVLGIKCWSNTLINYLNDPKKRLLRMVDLPPRLKYKMLVSPANKQHLDNTVDLLVFLSQMGLVAVSPFYYPKIRQEIMLFLRKEAQIADTRFTEKTYCHTQLPEGMEKFPVNTYTFNSLADVEKYWTDLQFICLNTPLGLNRIERRETPSKQFSKEEEDLGKAGIGRFGATGTRSRMYRSFTVLRDFQQYYEGKDFQNMEPVVFGNGLGAAGLDSTFFGHLAKNWRYGKRSRPSQKKESKFLNSTLENMNESSLCADVPKEAENAGSMGLDGKGEATRCNQDAQSSVKKLVVSNLLVQSRRGGKGLKRKLASTTAVMTKKMKMERKKYFDKLIAKRFEHVREKVRVTEIKRKALRKGKKTLHAMNHDEKDREALRRMKGLRVSFSEREDAYILLSDIVKTMMKVTEKGQPLEKEHPKVYWHAIRDLLHKDVPESRDKTWNAIERRARYIKKYPHSLIVFKTCVAELEQDQEFMKSLHCTKEDWKEKLVQAFVSTREIYSRHFNQQVDMKIFPTSLVQLRDEFEMEYAHISQTDTKPVELKSEKDIRILLLQDLMHNSLTAQKLTSYIPAVAFKVFDAYPPDELNEAFEFYKQHRLISRSRVDVPRRRSLPISTMTYNLSTTYFRIFEPSMPLRIFTLARNLYVQVRDGKQHTAQMKEQEIMKMESVSSNGTCKLSSTCVQGGHVAYLLNGMVNKKIKLNFAMPDEMTVNDEAHMKRLREGNLNFQRVAFEQRMRRGESLVQRKRHLDKDPADDIERDNSPLKKSHLEPGKSQDDMMEIPCDDMSTIHSGDNTDKVKEGKNFTDIDNVIDSAKDGELTTHTSDVGTEKPPEQMSIISEVVTNSAHIDTSEGTESQPLSQSKAPISQLDKQFDDVNDDASRANENTVVSHSSLSRHKEDVKHIKRKSAAGKNASLNRKPKQFDCSSRTRQGSYGNCVVTLTTKPTLFTCLFSKTDPVNPVVSEYVPRCAVVRKEFDYTQQTIHKKSRRMADKMVDIFKHGKIHASRTALTMHRSIGDEKLMPTNAMNTHDALVINPMAISCHLLASPHRNLPKSKVPAADRDMLQRFRNQSKDEGYLGNSLTVKEYCAILRDELNYPEEEIVAHQDILAKIKSFYVLGIKKKDIQVLFADVFESVARDWNEHIQTLLNFRMIYSVGFYDERLVDSMYYTSWCFRAPQMASKFEHKKATGNEAGSKVGQSKGCKNEDANSRQVTSPTDGLNKSTDANETETKNAETATFTDATTETELINAETAIFIDATSSSSGYKITQVRPWLKLDGDLNGLLLKRFQETVLIQIMMNPGVTEKQLLKHFHVVMKPCAAKLILNFLVVNGCITKHFLQKPTCTLFSRVQDTYDGSFADADVYYLPTTTSLLNMTDINR